MPNERRTWIVLAREASELVRVEGQAQTWFALILDAGTGTVLAGAPEATQQEALEAACVTAATQPMPGAPPPGPPDEVWARQVLVPAVSAALAAALPDPPPVTVTEVIAEAEDIFDSMIQAMSGQPMVVDPPSADQWQQLYDELARLARTEPWDRWDDDEPLRIELTAAGTRSSWVAVLMGGAGIQRGVALYPGRSVPRAVSNSASTPEEATIPGSLLVFLDEADECPAYAVDKALRHGWPDELDDFPLCLVADDQRELGGLDATSATKLTGLLTAVLAHDQRLLDDAPAASSSATKGSTVAADQSEVRYTVRTAAR